MFKNLHEVYPEVEFHLLINRFTNEEHRITMDALKNMFSEERLLKLSNGSDPHWILLDPQ